MDEIVAALFGGLLVISIGHPVARIVLPCLSFGRVYAQPLPSSYSGFNIFGYRHDDNGRIEVDSAVAAAFGFAISLIVLCSFGHFIFSLF